MFILLTVLPMACKKANKLDSATSLKKLHRVLDSPQYIKHLMTGPEGNSEFCFPRISMFPETKSREH